METAIRTATADDLDAVVAVLTDAFTDDPLMAWAFRDDATRVRRLAGLWRFMAGQAYLPFGASTVAPGPAAAALWMAPGDSLGEGFWESHGPAFAEQVEGDVRRLAAMGEVMAHHHPADHEQWYLLAIGVFRDRQGRGLGSALLAHTLAAADAAGAPAWLEATSVRNRVLYERFGFEVVDELHVEDSPPFWTMSRPPASG